jgi:predicted AlkP superfamily phosphohydrolase/phosphomutase
MGAELKVLSRSKTGRPQVFVLGIDGVPFSLLHELVREGHLHNLGTILSQGSLKRMNSVLPCVSSVAWASYMTGMNPAKHSIFGFIDRVPKTMEMFIPTSSHMTAETLWEWLSRNGKRVVVVNVPGTYPPRMVNGILIAGFLCPDIDKIAYPRELAQELRAMGYRIDIDSWRARESKDDFLAEVNGALDKRFQAAFALMDRVDWDFFQLHIMETDRVNHFLLSEWQKGDPIYGPLFLKFYQRLDSYLGTLAGRITEETELIVLSDHGFCELKREVYLNHWLEQKGFLKMKKAVDSTGEIHPESRAYSLYPGRIYVNLEGREATGRVQNGREYETTRENLAEGLLGIRDPEDGAPIIKRVFKREEIYSGPYLVCAPDLVAIPHNGYDLKGNFARSGLTLSSEVSGMHTCDDALLFVRDREIKREDSGFGIIDAYTVVLRLMNIKKPVGIDAQDLI